MTTFRWIVLRLFWSLLALIPAAFFMLWLVHKYFLLQSNVFDEVVVALLGVILFALASHLLTREGARRFTFLLDRGKALLEANRETEMQDILTLLMQLLHGGLLSEKKRQSLQRQLLRSYFPFYADHPERSDFQEQLMLAMRSGVRPEEAYHVLKSYVLNQETLTLETANLAEELLDYRPDDETLPAFVVEYFLKEKKTHYRAEYFYAKYLSAGGPLTDKILTLCLPKVLRHPRRDEFTGWCLVQAFDHDTTRDPRVRQALYIVHQALQKSRRRDALAQQVAARAGQILPEEKNAWLISEKNPEKRAGREFVGHWRFQVRQWWWDGISLLRPYKREVALGFMILALFGIIYLTRSISFSNQAGPVAPAASAGADTTHYFSLQVVALKDKRSADAAAGLLQRRRLEVYVLEPRSSRGWYRVRVGKYSSARRARLAADSLKSAGLIDDYFVTNYEGR
ncbi:MAG: SPOR domain-containing protein [bacterium]